MFLEFDIFVLQSWSKKREREGRSTQHKKNSGEKSPAAAGKKKEPQRRDQPKFILTEMPVIRMQEERKKKETRQSEPKLEKGGEGKKPKKHDDEMKWLEKNEAGSESAKDDRRSEDAWSSNSSRGKLIRLA